ncbi:MAG: alpha/beta hydrolase fold domain-containing protein [Gemmatimonadota bacterium]
MRSIRTFSHIQDDGGCGPVRASIPHPMRIFPRSSPRHTALLTAVVALVLTGCGDGTPVTTAPVTGISLSPSQSTLPYWGQLALEVEIRTAQGLSAATSQLNWTSSDPTVAVVSPGGTVTGVGVGGPVTITAEAEGNQASVQVTVVPGAPARLLLQVAASPTVRSGLPVEETPVVEVRDQGGNRVRQAGISVLAYLLEGGDTAFIRNGIVETDENGVARFPNMVMDGKVGIYTLFFEAQGLGLQSASSGEVQIQEGPPVALRIFSDPSSETASGKPFPRQPHVGVEDSGGNPLALEGFQIRGVLVEGDDGATLDGFEAVTGGDGIARYQGLILEGKVGEYVLGFQSGELEEARSEVITLGHGDPHGLAFRTSFPTAARSGVALDPEPVVELRDRAGNTVPEAGTTVTALLIQGGETGILAGTTATTDASGGALFSSLAIEGITGEYRLRFTAPGLQLVETGILQLGPGIASRLGPLTPPPAIFPSGLPVPQAIQVHLLDGAGNVVPDEGVSVSASVVSSANVQLSGGQASSNSQGVITFPDLILSASGGATARLRFQGPQGIAAWESEEFEIRVPTRLVLSVQPSTPVALGLPLNPAPRVQILDQAGSPFPLEGLTIRATVVGGGGQVSISGIQATTDAQGQATFSILRVDDAPSGVTFRLEFQAPGTQLESVVSQQLEALIATRVGILQGPPPTGITGTAFTPAVQVILLDDAGRAVPSGGVTVTVSFAPGSPQGVLMNASGVTGDNGVATFPGLAIAGNPGSYQLRFQAEGLQGVNSGSIFINFPGGFQGGANLDVSYICQDRLLRMDVYVPSGTFFTSPRPVVFYVHGGSFISGSREGTAFFGMLRDQLVAQGYYVIALGYRLATSTGNDWPTQIQDVTCGVRYTRSRAAEWKADSFRTGAYGESAGGLMAALLGVSSHASHIGNGFLSFSSRVQAVATNAGFFDLSQKSELNFQSPTHTFTTWNDPGFSEELALASPITHVNGGDSPFLLIHGTADGTIDIAQSERFQQRLVQNGVSASLIALQGADHNPDTGWSAAQRTSMASALVNYFLQQLGQ